MSQWLGTAGKASKVFARGSIGVQPAPPPAGFVIQPKLAGSAGQGVNFPGASGMSARVSWYGNNNGVAGAQFIGVTVSGQATFLPGGQFGFGDGNNATRIPFVGNYFVVYQGAVSNQNDFTSVTINGHTYLTASVPYFDNAGGCGPTYWIWTGQPAGLVDGTAYSAVFV